jgi:hypothetical protein
VIPLATTDNRIRENAIIDFGSTLPKFMFGKKTKIVVISMISWLILAKISHILRSFILQNNCSGNCNIHAAIKLAEKIIPKGNHRTIYGLLVYAGKKYATIMATRYTIVIITNLVHTNLPYNAFSNGFSLLFSSCVFIFHKVFTAITYNPKSAMADHIAKNFNIVL